MCHRYIDIYVLSFAPRLNPCAIVSTETPESDTEPDDEETQDNHEDDEGDPDDEDVDNNPEND